MAPDLHDLDEDQRRAVGAIIRLERDPRRHLHVLIAMAGSGKTRSLTALLRELVSLGVRPETLVAISFTNRAANELRHRISTQIAGSAAYAIHSMTFHKFCKGLLPGGDERDIIDEHDTRGWFSEWIASKATALRCDWGEVFFGGAGEMVRLISLCKSRMMVPADATKLTLPDMSDEQAKVQLARLAEAWEGYEEWKDVRNAFDPNDLQWRLWLAMRAKPEIAEEARLRFHWMTIDEAQDLSPLQMHLARELAGKHLVMVGDINQSIYGFRGARRAMLAAIAQQETVDGRRVHVHWLPRNYRANSTLVKRGNKILGLQRDRDLLKPMKPTRDAGADVQVRWFADPITEAEETAKSIKALVESGVPGHEIAVLTRVNTRSMLVASELAKLDVPFTRAARFGFWGLWPVEQAMAYMRLAAGIIRPEDVGQATKAPRLYWPRDLTGLVAARLGNSPDIIHALRQPFNKRHHTRVAMHFSDILSGMAKAKSPTEALRRLYAAESNDRPPREKETFYTAGADRRARNDNSRAEALDQLLEIAGSAGSLMGFLDEADERARHERMLLNQRDKTKAGHVSIMSIHRVKGLEFDHVYLLGMNSGVLPHSKADPDEEARVFYVAQTRARAHLTISWTGDHPIESASPFLQVWPDLTARLAQQYQVPEGGPDAA